MVRADDPAVHPAILAGHTCRGGLEVGGAWKLSFPDGRVADTGEVAVCEPGKRLGIRWRNEFKAELKAEGWSLCTMEIEPAAGETVKLTVTHSIEREDSKLIGAVSGGWPQILSNLKSLLETGSVILPPREFQP
jgi:uncharacterized protein YndB with AHSA1/START domain